MKLKLPWHKWECPVCNFDKGEMDDMLTVPKAHAEAFRTLCEMAADLNQENWTECWKLGMRLLCEIFEPADLKEEE